MRRINPLGRSVDFYAYTFNNPTSQIDPIGLATVTNNTGVPILASGNPGQGHGSGGQVYGVIPPDGKTYGGADNPIPGYATPQDAVDAYYREGPMPNPVGGIYDVDFYSPTPLTPDTDASKLICSVKILGDDQGPHYTLNKNKKGLIVDSYPWYQLTKAVARRIQDIIDEHTPWWLRYLPPAIP